MIKTLLKYSLIILTPGVLILAYIVINQILDETITWDKLSFALVVFICWGFVFYYNKSLKTNHDTTKTFRNDKI